MKNLFILHKTVFVMVLDLVVEDTANVLFIDNDKRIDAGNIGFVSTFRVPQTSGADQLGKYSFFFLQNISLLQVR